MGKDWLANKLKNKKPGVWQDAQTARFSFTHEAPRLVKPGEQLTDADILFGDLREARNRLSASVAIDTLSICIKARDMKHKGRLVETWLRGSFIRRIIERPKPTREGVNHDRYSVLIAYLMQHGLVETEQRGYRWRHEFRHLPDRAEWLINLIRREGELRRVTPPSRFTILD